MKFPQKCYDSVRNSYQENTWSLLNTEEIGVASTEINNLIGQSQKCAIHLERPV